MIRRPAAPPGSTFSNLRKGVTVATVNVRGINEPAKRIQIEEWATKMRIKVLALTETHHSHNSLEGSPTMWAETGRAARGSYHWSASTSVDPVRRDKIEGKKMEGGAIKWEEWLSIRENAGVAIMLHEDVWQQLADVSPLGGRPMTAHLNGRVPLRVICAYAPQAHRPQEERETFYDELEEVLRQRKSKTMDILMGDFNARIVQREDDNCRTVGPHFHCSIEKDIASMTDEALANREAFMHMAKSNEFRICNTFFEKPPSKLVTYRRPTAKANAPPNPRTHDQRDYILIPQRWANTVTNCETSMHLPFETDHYPVMATLRVKFARRTAKTAKPPTRYDRKIRCEELVNDWNEAVERAGKPGEILGYNAWQQIYEDVLSKRPPTLEAARKEYISTDTYALILRRHKAYLEGRQEEYDALRKEVKKKCRADKRQYLLHDIHSKASAREKWAGIKRLR